MIRIVRNLFDSNLVDEINSAMRDEDGRWGQSRTTSSNSISSRKKETARVAKYITKKAESLPEHIVDLVVNTANEIFGYDLFPHEEWSIQKYLDTDRGHFYWHKDVLDYFKYDIADGYLSADKLFLNNIRPDRKVSISIGLNNRNEYEGGQFYINMNGDNTTKEAVDLDAGDAIFFDSNVYHEVADVTKGHRNALIIWLCDKEDYFRWKEFIELDSESP